MTNILTVHTSIKLEVARPSSLASDQTNIINPNPPEDVFTSFFDNTYWVNQSNATYETPQ